MISLPFLLKPLVFALLGFIAGKLFSDIFL
nr:MAG TPA: hypothetical protein [Caudoviricetes sp.]